MSRGASDLTADCRVGIAKGAWETVITQNAQNGGRRTFSRDGEQWTVIFRKATAVASGGAQVKLAYTVPYGRWNMQLVAAAQRRERTCILDNGRLLGWEHPLGVDIPRLRDRNCRVSRPAIVLD